MLLAIDTATSKIGLALFDGVTILHESIWQSLYRHTTEVAPAIEHCLERIEIQGEGDQRTGKAAAGDVLSAAA